MAYWYDARHELGFTPVNIDLRLRNLANNSVLMQSTDPYDNKERVFYSSAGSSQVAIELVGTGGFDASFHYLTCSTPGRVRVNVAWFYEDDARNDPFATPGWDPVTGIGVEPE